MRLAATLMSLLLSAPALASRPALQPPEPRPEPIAEVEKPLVTLLDSGIEPRTLLRYKPAKGQREALEMTMVMNMTMKMNDFDMPAMKMPTMRMRMEVQITDVAANGDFTYHGSITRAEVLRAAGQQEEVFEAMQQQMAGFTDLEFTAVCTDRGETRSFEVKIPEDSPPQVRPMFESMRQSIQQMTTPLPLEPVGMGASWSALTSFKVAEIKSDLQAEFALAAIDGDAFIARITMKQTVDSQEVKSPLLPPEVKVRIVKSDASGTGETAASTRFFAPTSSYANVRSSTETEIEQGEMKQLLKQDMSMEVRVKRLPPEAVDEQAPENSSADDR